MRAVRAGVVVQLFSALVFVVTHSWRCSLGLLANGVV